MTWTVCLRIFALAAACAALTLNCAECSFRATQDFGPDGTASSRSVSPGVNLGLPGLRGLGAGGGSPDAGGGNTGDFVGGGPGAGGAR